jgi:hypothetical protein
MSGYPTNQELPRNLEVVWSCQLCCRLDYTEKVKADANV